MSHRESLDEQDPTIGTLVVDAFDDLGTLLRHIIELAKSELRISIRTGGTAIALFLLAGFMSLLAIVMVSIAIAFFIAMTGLDLAWCFLIVYRKVRKVRAPERTLAEVQETPRALLHKG